MGVVARIAPPKSVMAFPGRAGGQNCPPEYVHRCQVQDVIASFAAKHAPHLSGEALAAAIYEALSACSWVDTPQHAQEQMASNAVPHLKLPGDLQIVFQHECLALGCRDTDCTLCQYNPVRACGRSFSKKYLVGDALKATCGAPIKAELSSGGMPWDKELPGVAFEVVLLDGVMFKEKGGETRQLSVDDIKACIKFNNHRDEALLQLKSGAYSSGSRKIFLRAESGRLSLPEMHVTDSSEALLTGRKPPFRLIIFPVSQEDGSMLPDLAYGVSEEFVVATRRVKLANKSEIPLMDDHVGKIEHIGRETMKKLLDIRTAAAEGGMMLQLPDRLLSVSTVGQFVELVGMAEKEAHLKKVLQIVLKLSKEKWEEAASHALQAVMSDFRRRVWYPPGLSMTAGLLFSVKYGAVQLNGPVALVKLVNFVPEGGRVIVQEDELDPDSLNMLRTLKVQAVSCWWMPGHPGWAIFKEATTVTPPAAPLPSVSSAGHPSKCRAEQVCTQMLVPYPVAAVGTPGSLFSPALDSRQRDGQTSAGALEESSAGLLDGERAPRNGTLLSRLAPGTRTSSMVDAGGFMPEQCPKRLASLEAGAGSPHGAHERSAENDAREDSFTGLSALAAAAAVAAAEDDASGNWHESSSTSRDGNDERLAKAAKHAFDSTPADSAEPHSTFQRKQVLVSMPSLQLWASDKPVPHVPSNIYAGMPSSQASLMAGVPGVSDSACRKVTITTSAAWPMSAQRDGPQGRSRSSVGPRSPSAVIVSRWAHTGDLTTCMRRQLASSLLPHSVLRRRTSRMNNELAHDVYSRGSLAGQHLACCTLCSSLHESTLRNPTLFLRCSVGLSIGNIMMACEEMSSPYVWDLDFRGQNEKHVGVSCSDSHDMMAIQLGMSRICCPGILGSAGCRHGLFERCSFTTIVT